MFSFKSVYFVIFSLTVCQTLGKISDKRLCVDENCAVPVALGKTLLRYNSVSEGVLSFGPNENLKIYSYGAGSVPDLIGVELNGKRGYVNKNHVKELRLLNRPKLLVDTELAQDNTQVHLQEGPTEIKPDSRQEPYEIIDGTKIPISLSYPATEASIISESGSLNEESKTEPLSIDNQKPTQNEPQTKDETEKAEGNYADIKTSSNGEKENDDEVHVEDQGQDEEEEEEEIDIDDGDEEEDEPETSDVVDVDIEGKHINNEIDGGHKIEEPAQASDNISSTENNRQSKENSVVNSTKSGQTTIEGESSNVYLSEQLELNQNKTKELNSGESPVEVKSELNDTLEIIETKLDIEMTTLKENVDTSKTDETKLPAVEEKNSGFTTVPPFVDDILDPLQIDVVTPNPQDVSSNSEPPEYVDKSSEIISPVYNLLNNLTPKVLEDVNIEESASKGSPEQTMENLNKDMPLETHQSVDNVDEQPSHQPQSVVDKVNDANLVVGEDIAGTFKENVFDEIVKGDLPMDEVTKEPLEANPENNQNGVLSSITEELPKDEVTDALLEKKPEINSNGILSSITQELPKEEVTEAPFEENPENNSNGIFSSITSFFSFSGNQEDKTAEGEKTESATSTENTLGHSLSSDSQMEEAAHINSDSPFLEHIVPENANRQDICDSKLGSCPQSVKEGFCDNMSEDCSLISPDTDSSHEKKTVKSITYEELQEVFLLMFQSDMFIYLTTTSLSVLTLLFIWSLLEKYRREVPLIARINKLEKQLVATLKENEMLQEGASLITNEENQLSIGAVSNEVVEELRAQLSEMNATKSKLEEQIQILEKDLDASTEMGIELNKIISEMLNSSDGNEIIKENIEQMQKKVLEQQGTIKSLNETLNLRDTEIYELRLELEISNKKVTDLQGEVNKMVEKILKIEEERNQQHSTLENEIILFQNKCKDALTQEHVLKSEITTLNQKLAELQRTADTKIKEYNTLKESISTLKSVNNDKEVLKSFLNVSELKAELEQLKSENSKYSTQLSQERSTNVAYATQIQSFAQEVKELKERYERADKAKVETNTKLEVLNNYFKEKEEQLQKEISKYESLWMVKEGEATSTTERIKYMQEELQNYKTQNESLKQEIVNQEVELKSQISMLEKKVHENWVVHRQTERKLEEARQEAALLRNRLTMRERAFAEGNNHIRMQSPLQQNGDMPISPPPPQIDPTQSPPPLFNPRDHITKSPPIPGMPPPPFLPPPLGGAPFLPPPPLDGMMPPPLEDIGRVPFIPRLHYGILPGDHRPPPLGRMSSPPPVGGRYSPESTIYSEYDRYDRRSPSPPYDSEYGASPPPIRGYSPYNERDRLRDDRREYNRSQVRSNGRNAKGIHSSGSENDSLGNRTNKKTQRKV